MLAFTPSQVSMNKALIMAIVNLSLLVMVVSLIAYLTLCYVYLTILAVFVLFVFTNERLWRRAQDGLITSGYI